MLIFKINVFSLHLSIREKNSRNKDKIFLENFN